MSSVAKSVGKFLASIFASASKFFLATMFLYLSFAVVNFTLDVPD